MKRIAILALLPFFAAVPTGRADPGREALEKSPLVTGRPILFVVRQQYRRDHHNTATMFQTGEINTGSFTGGGALKTIDLTTGEVKTLLDVPEGVVRDPDVSFDGSKILFSLRRNTEDDYHLYEINADGSGLRQLTYSPGIDTSPAWSPGGREIAFTSSRSGSPQVYVKDSEGANLRRI